MPFRNQPDQVAATIAAANALGFSLPTAQAEKAVKDYQASQYEKYISDQAAKTVAEANALGFSLPKQQAEKAVKDYYEQMYKPKHPSQALDPVAATVAAANTHGFSISPEQATQAIRDYYAYNDPVPDTVLKANALGFSLPQQQAKDAVIDYYIHQFATYGNVPLSEQVKAQIVQEALIKYAGLDDEIRDLGEQAWTGVPIDMARYESLKEIQAKIDKIKNAAQEAYMAQPVWTESELKAQSLKETDPDQYRDLIISDDYINGNWQRWLELAQPGRILTTDERKEAKAAAYALNQKAHDIYWSIGTPRQISDDAWQQYNTYISLAPVLQSKESELMAVWQGVGNVIPVEKIRTALYNNIPAFKDFQDGQYNDPVIADLMAKTSMAENAQAANPGWYIGGNLAGTALFTVAGGELLSGLGITSNVVKNVILSGIPSAVNSVADQDWSEPGKALFNTVFETGASLLSGYVGGKAAQATFSKVGQILEYSALSTTAKKLLADNASTIMSNVGGTISAETLSAAKAAVMGEEYHFDPGSAAINIVVGSLFDTVGSIKDSFFQGSAEYTKAANIQAKLQIGDASALKDAVGFVNESAPRGLLILPDSVKRPLSVEETKNAYFKGFEKYQTPDKPTKISLVDRIKQYWDNPELPESVQPYISENVIAVAENGPKGYIESTGQQSDTGYLIDLDAAVNDFLSDGSTIIATEGAGDGLSGPVEITPPSNATPEQIAQTRAYIDGSNQALEAGKLSPSGRVSTAGSLRIRANASAAAERARAAAAGTPYQGHVGHVPDTTWTGTADPFSWLDLDPSVNMSIGGQANRYPIGYKPTEFRFKDR